VCNELQSCVNGTRNPDIISPDSWNMDQYVLDRPGNKEIQLALLYDYQNNLKEYPTWHEYFRINQPLAWGKTTFSLGHMVHWHSKRILKMRKFIY
jgi:hypothetical protein